MKTTPFILALLLLAGMATTAWADGGFFGNITYKGVGCDCAYPPNADQVKIENTSTGEIWYAGIRCGGSPGYTTSLLTFPPGPYKLNVIPRDPDCVGGLVVYVTHGLDNQQVDLTVVGDSGTPTGPQGP